MMPDTTVPSGFKRHPLVYLVEAADDICYNIIDLEDAHRLQILPYEHVEALLLPLCRDPQLPARLQGLEDRDSRVSLLRAKAINTLIRCSVDVFVNDQEDFLQGTFGSALLDALDEDLTIALKEISQISVKKIYNAPSVVQIELAGYKVMGGLLEEFIPAYLADEPSSYQQKLRAIIPSQFHDSNPDPAARIRCVLDFVSGMTDLFAVDLYRKIKGISFPSLD